MIEELFDWLLDNKPRKAWIAWINGAAGAGKSAICRSFAEMCIQLGFNVACFFFFRTDAARNSIDPVVATLAYQIIQLIPDTRELIVHAIETHPMIFEQAFETQLDVLIVDPMRQLHRSDENLMLLLIIDGVNECTGNRVRKDLILAFSKLLQHGDLPLVVLFGTRRESYIQMAFNSRDTDNILKELSLDTNYRADDDIQLFLAERFEEIKRTHPLRRHLAQAWPAVDHVEEIVDKSSGQFVYASVVMNFVSIPSSNPSTQLEIVHGLRPVGRVTPFAELDMLYRHLFTQVDSDDRATALRFLAYAILIPLHSMQIMLHFFDVVEEDMECILAPLTSVLFHDEEQDKIVFHHVSLPDFLQDKDRSQEYCISEMGTELSILWFKNAVSGRFNAMSEGE